MGCRGSLFPAHTRVVLLVVAVSGAAACGSRPLDQMDAAGGGGGGLAGAGGSGGDKAPCAAATAGAGGQGSRLVVACTDGLDNDGDGKADYDDPECIGGHDNDEATFAWSSPDGIDDCRTDCFFDGGFGAGDDGCVWQLRCDPANAAPKCPYDAAYAAAHPEECSLSSASPQMQACADRCGRLVPNGCDCFGCCAVPGLPGPVRLAQACTAADLGDPQKCPPCTQVTWCLNPCERCELCVGKPVLPDDCTTPNGGAPYTCPAGAPACGASGIAPVCCPAATNCVTGCCLPLDP